ncbi:MAG: hypothetical protein JSS24_08875 [Proteobacteria bacterium]|nr:hypothetical protein [Pseudomonadota bacterium]
MKRLVLTALLLNGAALAAGSAFAAGAPLRDPTRPPQPAVAHTRATGPSVPVVSAILARDGTDGTKLRKAIVDGRWVRAGDEIAGGRIQAISADGVCWMRRGQVHELRVVNPNSIIKKPAAQPPGAKGAA